MSEEQQFDCGTKHMKMMAIIIAAVLAIAGSGLGLALGVMAGHDARLRIVEQGQAARQAQYDDIQRSLNRIEMDVKELKRIP